MIKKVLLLVIDGMDTVNFTMGNTPTLNGLHGKTAVGVAHTEIIGAGAVITPVAHAMMGTGYNVLAHRPGVETMGRSYDYYGNPVETIGDVCREHGFKTAAVGKNEAAIVLGGIDKVEITRLEKDGVNAGDAEQLAAEILQVFQSFHKGVLVANYAQVDLMAHYKDVNKLIEAVENADKLVSSIIQGINLMETLVVIASDHGTNPMTGNHNTAPTPLCLITEQIKGRKSLGVVHIIEIAATITQALGLPKPKCALGRNLLEVALGDGQLQNYQVELQRQLEEVWRTAGPRHDN